MRLYRIYKQIPKAEGIAAWQGMQIQSIIKEREHHRIGGDCIKMNKKEKEVYEAYKDRLSMPSKPRKLTPEEIAELKKQGKI